MHLLPNAGIVFEDGKIVEVKRGEPQADLVEDRPEWILCPCFVNAHVHLGDSAFKDMGYGSSLEELFAPPNGVKHRLLRETSERILIQAMRDALLDMMASGTGVVADFREGGSKGVALALDACRDLSIRLLTFHRPDHSFTAQELDANKRPYPEEALAELEKTAPIVSGIAPSSPNDVTDAALGQLREYAARHGLLRGTHAAENPRSREIAIRRAGSSEVTRAIKFFGPDFIVHMIYCDEQEIELVASSGISLICCPRANRSLGLGLPPIRRFLDRGINVALGTDNVMLNSPDMFAEMDFLLMAYDRIRPAEILRMATINGARALKVEAELGSIEVGKEASFVAVNFADRNLRFSKDPLLSLVHRARPHNVERTYIRGQVAYDRSGGAP